MRAQYGTTFGRAALALFIGAGFGGVLVTAQTVWIAILEPGNLGLALWPMVLLVAFVVWALGLVLFSPVWSALHRLNHRTPWVALMLGFASAGLASVLLYLVGFTQLPACVHINAEEASRLHICKLEYLTAEEWRRILYGSVLLASSGAMVGLVVWRVAYRKLG